MLVSVYLTLSLSLLPLVHPQVAPSYHQTLETLANSLPQARAQDNNNGTSASLPDAQLSEAFLLMTSSFEYYLQSAAAGTGSSSASDVGNVFLRSVKELLDTVSAQNITSELCLNHTMAMLEGIVDGEDWARQMLDATGKPGAGITLGNINWPGTYEQCLSVRANTTVTSHPNFAGHYCTLLSGPMSAAGLTPPSAVLSLGACVPDTCNSTDLTLLLEAVVTQLNKTDQIQPSVVCAVQGKSLSAKAIVAIIICSIILCLMVAGTAVDVVYVQWPVWTLERMAKLPNGIKANGRPDINDEEQPLLSEKGSRHISVHTNQHSDITGVGMKMLLAFSVYTNGAKLLSTKQPAGSLTCVHGIRFLSMTWVVIGHSWGFPISFSTNPKEYLEEASTHWTYQTIMNATFSVDTFFVLSGMLVAFLTLKEMRKREGKLNWFLFYFHRFWRLTPPYMLCLMVSVCLSSYMGQGPFWPQKFSDEDACADTWWANLLYINNFVGLDKQCFVHSWYLANDMQFYILSPLIFLPLFFIPWLGSVVALVFLLATSIVPGVLTQEYHLPPGILQPVQGRSPMTVIGDYMKIYYFKPYTRMGAYVVGMLAGYFLYRYNCKLRIHRVVNLVMWSVATACALAVLYGLSRASNGHPVTLEVSALYNAVSRQVWAACVAWVVIACVTGNGGFVNTLLSWRAFVPLSRLSYCVYLLHLTVMQVCIYNRDTRFYLSALTVTMFFLAVLMITYAVGFVASLAFESPMMGLEKLLLSRESRDQGSDKEKASKA